MVLKPSVDIIIVTWNGLALLQKCLPSVMATRYETFRVVVADNASSDDTVDWIRERYPDVSIVEHDANYGFSAGNNRAIETSDADYVVLLNNDVEVHRDWLSHLVDRAESDHLIGAVSPKLLQFDDRGRFEYAGAAGGYLDEYGYPFARGRIFDTLEVDDAQYDNPASVFWGSGAALLIRRRILARTGLLDEHFYMHMEEIDLCWRIQRAGFTVVCEPQAIAYHIGGASLGPRDPRKVFYNFRNSLLMLYKNGGQRQWPRRFLVRLCLDGLAGIRFLLLGRPGAAWAIVRAYYSAHVLKSEYASQRGQEDEIPPSYRGSIAIAYYLRGLKRFADLPSARFRQPTPESRRIHADPID